MMCSRSLMMCSTGGGFLHHSCPGLGFGDGVQDLGFRVWGWGLGFGVQDSGFRVRVQISARVQIILSWFRVWGLGFRILGLGLGFRSVRVSRSFSPGLHTPMCVCVCVCVCMCLCVCVCVCVRHTERGIYIYIHRYIYIQVYIYIYIYRCVCVCVCVCRFTAPLVAGLIAVALYHNYNNNIYI